jgi:Aldehyde dehydrogenase family
MSDGGVTEVNGIKEYRYFAGGEWRTAENHKLFDVYRPYDRSLYARVAVGGRPEAKLAVDAAAKAFPAWSQTTPAERARLFRLDLLEDVLHPEFRERGLSGFPPGGPRGRTRCTAKALRNVLSSDPRRGMPTTHADTINADLLAFIKS